LAPKFLIPLSQIALTGSVYTIVAITVERYFACCWPLVPPREGKLINGLCIGTGTLFIFGVAQYLSLQGKIILPQREKLGQPDRLQKKKGYLFRKENKEWNFKKEPCSL
jgi:hypothetical protein